MDRITTIIFDCFGVLYPDAEGDYIKRHQAAFDNNPTLPDKLFTQIDLGQISLTEFYAALAKQVKVSLSKVKFEIERDIVVDKELVKLIRKLKKDYKIGLLSNAGEEEVEILYRDGIDGLFDAMTISYEVGDVKPNPKIYASLLDRLNALPEESVFIDDNVQNLEGAQRIGIQTIHYPKFGVIPESLMKLVAQN